MKRLLKRWWLRLRARRARHCPCWRHIDHQVMAMARHDDQLLTHIELVKRRVERCEDFRLDGIDKLKELEQRLLLLENAHERNCNATRH